MRLLISGLLFSLIGLVQASTFSTAARYQLCFTPAEKCQQTIVTYIRQAKNSIEVQAYSFTSKAIAYALINASKRGVSVKMIVDRSEILQKSRLYLLLKHHIPVWLDDKVATAHNKVMIFDQEAVLTGSYNFTNAAEYRNAENSLYIVDRALAARYHQNWLSRLKQSRRLAISQLSSVREQLLKSKPY